ncbi:MAG: hypothetical protein GYB50_25345 [Rhodobacteraceae bacterium]|nr:hypothetical protein [Paracoccaceae bacterium]
MIEHLRNNMVTLADLYAQHMNISLWRVSFLVRGNGNFFGRLSGRYDPDGKGPSSCNLRTVDAVFQWFDANWPGDLEWPADIHRPSSSDNRGAA